MPCGFRGCWSHSAKYRHSYTLSPTLSGEKYGLIPDIDTLAHLVSCQAGRSMMPGVAVSLIGGDSGVVFFTRVQG